MKTYNSVELLELIESGNIPFKGTVGYDGMCKWFECDSIFSCYLNDDKDAKIVCMRGGNFYKAYNSELLPISTKFSIKEDKPFKPVKGGEYSTYIISFHGVEICVGKGVYEVESWTHIACRSNGDVCLYNYKPEAHTQGKDWGCSSTDNRKQFSCSSYYIANIKYTGDWENSLLPLSDCTITKHYLV